MLLHKLKNIGMRGKLKSKLSFVRTTLLILTVIGFMSHCQNSSGTATTTTALAVEEIIERAPRFVPQLQIRDFAICLGVSLGVAECTYIISKQKFTMQNFVCSKGVVCINATDVSMLLSEIQAFCSQNKTSCRIIAHQFRKNNEAVIVR